MALGLKARLRILVLSPALCSAASKLLWTPSPPLQNAAINKGLTSVIMTTEGEVPIR